MEILAWLYLTAWREGSLGWLAALLVAAMALSGALFAFGLAEDIRSESWVIIGGAVVGALAGTLPLAWRMYNTRNTRLAQASGQDRPRTRRPLSQRRLFLGLAGAYLLLVAWSATVIWLDRGNPTTNAPGAANEAAESHPGNAVSGPREPETQAIATVPVAPQSTDREEYGVVVGRLRVSSDVLAYADGGTLWQRPELWVRIRRLDPDPAVLAEVDAINEEIDERREILYALNRRAEPLEEKERLSERQPGPPLTEQERTRFEELRTRDAERSRRLAELSAYRYERQRLERKHEASLQGPPLTAAEAAWLSEFRGQLEAANRANPRRRAVLLRRLAPSLRRRGTLLEEKERLSQRQPGPPLTERERARLDELSEPPGVPLSVSEEHELERLQIKHEANLWVPGPPLTAAEAASLSELVAQREQARVALSAAEEKRDSLVDGRTSIIVANSNTVVFNERIFVVYPGDTLRVGVLDNDFFTNDVLGSFRLDVTAELLEAGEDVLLDGRPNVESLQLRFRKES